MIDEGRAQKSPAQSWGQGRKRPNEEIPIGQMVSGFNRHQNWDSAGAGTLLGYVRPELGPVKVFEVMAKSGEAAAFPAAVAMEVELIEVQNEGWGSFLVVDAEQVGPASENISDASLFEFALGPAHHWTGQKRLQIAATAAEVHLWEEWQRELGIHSGDAGRVWKWHLRPLA